MSRFLDARIPVVFVASAADAAAGDAILVEGEAAAEAGAAGFAVSEHHVPECRCCRGRSGAAQALSSLFLQGARGTGPLFSRVAVVAGSDAGAAAVRAALDSDVLVSQWFRLR